MSWLVSSHLSYQSSFFPSHCNFCLLVVLFVLYFRRKRKRDPVPVEEEECDDQVSALSKEEAEKNKAAKIDDLWASFKRDTDPVRSKGKIHFFPTYALTCDLCKQVSRHTVALDLSQSKNAVAQVILLSYHSLPLVKVT